MYSKKIRMCFIVFVLIGASLNCHAETVSISCDNENEDSQVGETFFEVEGEIDLDNSTTNNLYLKYKKVSLNKDEIIGEIEAKNIKLKKENKNKSIYSFDGRIQNEKYNVEITLNFSTTRGINYGISVNNQKLPWCTLL